MIILLSWKRNGGSEMLSNLSQVTQIAHGTTRFQTLPCGTLKASMSLLEKSVHENKVC